MLCVCSSVDCHLLKGHKLCGGNGVDLSEGDLGLGLAVHGETLVIRGE